MLLVLNQPKLSEFLLHGSYGHEKAGKVIHICRAKHDPNNSYH